MTTILHVEDEESVRTKVKDLFAGSGFDVFSASDVEEAERLMKTQVFDLILSDSDLPARFEGLHFVLSVMEKDPAQRIVILAEKHQFRKVPFISKGALETKEMFLSLVRQALAVE